MTTPWAVRSVAERLERLLLAEGAPARCNGDLRRTVEKIRSDMNRIEQNPDIAKSNTRELKNNVMQLAFDIEDATESYVRQEAESEGKSGIIRCLSKCLSSSSRFQEELNALQRKIDAISHRVMDDAPGNSGTHHTISRFREPNFPSEELHGDSFIGLEDNEKAVLGYLTGEPSHLTAVAITGMGGMGKTTLARRVYNHRFVVEYFDIRSWVTVSQDFEAQNTLEALLNVIYSGWEMKGMERVELMKYAYKALKGRRYLIVLDDVWSTKAWDTLKIIFPDDLNGSRILITTRLRDVAEYSAGHSHTLQLKFLDQEQSWKLFLSTATREGLLRPEMEGIGREIVKLCHGLPLAIKVLGGLLRIDTHLAYWETMLEELRISRLRGEGDQLLSILALSYHSLPTHLKPCLLYLGQFPEDKKIPLDKLYLLWMAEGMITTRDSNNKTRLELARGYIKELDQRSLVQMVETDELPGTCWVHDLIRYLCINIMKDEGFSSIFLEDGGGITWDSSRKLAIYLNGRTVDFLNMSIHHANRVRSLLFFNVDYKQKVRGDFIDLNKFSSTRVLDFDGVDFQGKKFPRGMEKLLYLRYLSFRECHLEELPPSIINFVFLEMLDLSVRASCEMRIPNVLRKLLRLRHLSLPLAFRCTTKDKLKLDTLLHLEILENFNATICDSNDLEKLEKLEKFTGMVDGNNADLKNVLSVLERNNFPSHSSLVMKNFDSYSTDRLSMVENLLKSNALHALNIVGYLGKLSLHDMTIGSNFSKIVLNGSEFKEDDLPNLGMLPKLKILELCNDAFLGVEMVFDDGQFAQLRNLKLASMHVLEKLEVSDEGLPCLKILKIEKCDKLTSESMPEEFQNRVQIIYQREGGGVAESKGSQP